MKILLNSLAGIGDTLMATPLIHELRLHFPDAIIDALVLWPGSKQVLEGNPHLNQVHQVNLLKERVDRSISFLWGLRKQRYDISLNTYPQSRRHYRLVAWFVRAGIRISHVYENFTSLDQWLVNATVKQGYDLHCIENNLNLLKALGKEALLKEHGYELFLTPKERQVGEDFLEQHRLRGQTLIGMHVGSGSTKNLALRRWPVEHYLELSKMILGQCPGAVVLLLGGPEEKADHERIIGEVQSERIVAPRTQNIREAAALLAKCAMFLSVDTALMHLAAAVKVPKQIVIETPTCNKTVEPYGNRFVLVPNPAVHRRTLEFYRYDGRGIRGGESAIKQTMQSVSAEAVFKVVKGNLGSTPQA